MQKRALLMDIQKRAPPTSLLHILVLSRANTPGSMATGKSGNMHVVTGKPEKPAKLNVQ